MSEKREKKGYGWLPDLPDHRDHVYAAPAEALTSLPAKFDLRPGCPPVYDQGHLGSCTGNAIAGAVEFDLMKQHLQDFIPSRLFIYYNERVMEGTVNIDHGAIIRDGLKSVGKQGVCPENEWPYDISKFSDKPTQQCYTDALKTKAASYSRVARTLNQMKGCLASGYPFVIGITVYQSFEDSFWEPGDANIPLPPMPQDGDPLGGHAILVVGYDDSQNRFICRNSWGTDHTAMNGYLTIPYAYLLDMHLSQDFWTIRVVT